MALKAVVSDLAEVEEPYRALYEAMDGRFVLALEGIDDHPAVASLRNALGHVRRERDEARRARLEAFAELGHERIRRSRLEFIRHAR